MANLKSLAKDTAIYGLSSIIGRFLNYLLVPLYTHVIASSSGDYGVVTNLYAYTALLLVILTYGMETTFFRFSNKEGENPDKVYSTILTSVLTTSVLFAGLVVLFIKPISSALGYAGHPSYVWAMTATVAIDALPVHSVLVPQAQEASSEVRRVETTLHRIEYIPESRLFCDPS